jgi:hypothetical protein
MRFDDMMFPWHWRISASSPGIHTKMEYRLSRRYLLTHKRAADAGILELSMLRVFYNIQRDTIYSVTAYMKGSCYAIRPVFEWTSKLVSHFSPVRAHDHVQEEERQV